MSKRTSVWPWISAPVLLVAGTVVVAAAFMGGNDKGDDAIESPTAPAVTTAVVPRVADLMKRAGCKGKTIGTQLYAAETGRCTLANGEVTVATFETAQLRSKWVRAARDLGGTTHFGDGWAIWSPSRTAASTFAAAIR
jgi:hypothetical protein